MSASRARVIGVGQEARGDDAVGRLLVRRLAADARLPSGTEVREHDGDGMDLVLLLEGVATVLLVDAVVSGTRSPGTLLRLDANEGPLPARLFAPHSTHLLGVAEAVELARVTDRLPARLILFGVEAADFGFGRAPTAAVEAALPVLLERVLEELGAAPRSVA